MATVNVLLLELICSNLDGNALEDAFRAKNVTVKMVAAQFQSKAEYLAKAFNKVLKKSPPSDPKNMKALPAYPQEQLLTAVGGHLKEEEFEAMISYFRQKFSRSYDDGFQVGFYTGEFSKGGERQGRGIFEFENGQRYQGEWHHDKFHGEGIYTLKDGARFDGQWREGKQLQGTYVWPGLKTNDL